MDENQCAYRKSHSCELALLGVTNEAFLAMDNSNITLMVFLDLTSAFDTVRHELLIAKLNNCNINGDVLKWFNAYLSERSHAVCINEVVSERLPLATGVPQGSVLGPVLFNLYMTGIGMEITKHNVSYKLYADDILLYYSCKPSVVTGAIALLESCLEDVVTWLKGNDLVLNVSKTEFLIVGTPHQTNTCGQQVIKVDGIDVKCTTSVKYLGVELDNSLKMQKQIGKANKSAYCNLRLLYRLTRSMDTKVRRIAANALVCAHLEYAMTLYHGVPKKQLKRLERVLRATRRFIDGKSDNLSTTKEGVEIWLNMAQRIMSRILMVTYEATRGNAPQFVCRMLTKCESSQNLRSNTQNYLLIPRTTKAIGDRAFSSVAPKLWNQLPLDVRRVNNRDSFCDSVAKFLVELP
jgi:hypothetical protein